MEPVFYTTDQFKADADLTTEEFRKKVNELTGLNTGTWSRKYLLKKLEDVFNSSSALQTIYEMARKK